MIIKLTVIIIYLIMATLLVAATWQADESHPAVGAYRAGGLPGRVDGLTVGEANVATVNLPADFRAGHTLPPKLVATMDITGVVYSWAKTWGGSSDDTINHIEVDGAGNVYVAGNFIGTVDFDPDPVKTDTHTSHNGTIDAFLSKFDANGQFLWAKTWGGGNVPVNNRDLSGRDTAYGVGVDGAGNAYVVGPFRNTVDFNPDPTITETHISNAGAENNIYLSKFAPDGTFQWVRTWGPSDGGAESYSVIIDGNYLYMVGDFSGSTTDFNPWGTHDYHTNHPNPKPGPAFDAFLAKFDLNGTFQWAKTWGGEGYDDGPGVAMDANHDVYVAGMYASQTINFDPAGGSGGLGHPAHDSGSVVDVFLSKFDSNGNFIRVITWGGQGTEDATGIVTVDGANNVYVVGRFASVDCDFDTGAGEDKHSTHNPAPPGSDWQRQQEAWDIFVSKFAPDGTFQWAKTWGGNGQDNAMGVAVDTSGNVYVSGEFSDTVATDVDFDPGIGVDNHRSNGQQDAFISQFDTNGNFNWAKSWGGSGNDSSSIIVNGPNVYAAGGFVGLVDFNPDGAVDNHTAVGGSDAFLSMFAVDLPVTGLTAANSGPTALGNITALTATVTTGYPVTYTWNLGDFTFAGGAVVTHAFLAAGVYTAIVTASNSISVITATTTITIYNPPAPAPNLSISNSGPASARASERITYTLTVTNNGPAVANNLVISDTLPAGANYISGGMLVLGVVQFVAASLAANGGVTTTQFVVTATQTITNNAYLVTASGGYSATGAVKVVTVVGQDYTVYLPVVMR